MSKDAASSMRPNSGNHSERLSASQSAVLTTRSHSAQLACERASATSGVISAAQAANSIHMSAPVWYVCPISASNAPTHRFAPSIAAWWPMLSRLAASARAAPTQAENAVIAMPSLAKRCSASQL